MKTAAPSARFDVGFYVFGFAFIFALLLGLDKMLP